MGRLTNKSEIDGEVVRRALDLHDQDHSRSLENASRSAAINELGLPVEHPVRGEGEANRRRPAAVCLAALIVAAGLGISWAVAHHPSGLAIRAAVSMPATAAKSPAAVISPIDSSAPMIMVGGPVIIAGKGRVDFRARAEAMASVNMVIWVNESDYWISFPMMVSNDWDDYTLRLTDFTHRMKVNGQWRAGPGALPAGAGNHLARIALQVNNPSSVGTDAAHVDVTSLKFR